MISESIQFLAGIRWICFFVSPTGSNKSKSDCAGLLLKISFWQRYCRMLLKAYGHADDGKGWVFRMKWSRSPSENWLYVLSFSFFSPLSFFKLFPSVSEPLSHLFVIAKNNCQPLLQCLYATIQLFLCLPLPNVSMEMQPDVDTSLFAFPSLCLALFLWRSVTFCTIFFLRRYMWAD